MRNLLKEKIVNRDAKVSVIGLGYVGLPLAIEIAKESFDVMGLDISKEKLSDLRNGKSYLLDVSDQELQQVLNKKLFVSDDFSTLSAADVVMICVPTPLDEKRDPDLSYITNVMNEIVGYLKRGTLILLESTVYPGATEELIIQKIEKTLNYSTGDDFFVCFSPERVDPNNQQYKLKNTPKIVGGSTQTCLELGQLFYSQIVEKIIPVRSIQVAEIAKLVENTFRSVNIAFMNELTEMCEKMGVSIWEVIDAAASKPYGYMPFYPGPGVGGHCIPVDPAYLAWKAKSFGIRNQFIQLSMEINDSRPEYVIEQITDLLNRQGKSLKGSMMMILGVAYKKDIEDVRESPAIAIIQRLMEKEVSVVYHDPFVAKLEVGEQILYSEDLSAARLREMDLVVIHTDHSTMDYPFVIQHANLIYDTRNVLKDYNAKNVFVLGEVMDPD